MDGYIQTSKFLRLIFLLVFFACVFFFCMHSTTIQTILLPFTKFVFSFLGFFGVCCLLCIIKVRFFRSGAMIDFSCKYRRQSCNLLVFYGFWRLRFNFLILVHRKTALQYEISQNMQNLKSVKSKNLFTSSRGHNTTKKSN